MKYSRSVVWLALLPVLLVASCEWPEFEETPAVRGFTKQPLTIAQPVRLEFECREYCSEYALRVVNVSCPDGSCAVQNQREIIALRARVHAVFEVAVLSRSRNEQILTGTFEADATDLRLVIAIDRTPLPALPPVADRSESAFLVGSQFRLSIGETRCPPGSDSYKCNGFAPTNGFTLSADGAAVRLARHEEPRPGWFWYDGFAEQSGRATFEARNNAGPIPIDPPSSVEVGTADDVVEQWLLTSFPSNRACANIASATIAGARCISTEPMVVFADPPGFSANVTSLVRLRSGTYLYGGAMATTLEPDQGPVDTTNIAAPQRKIVWAQPPSPSARIVTRLGATERAYSFSTCVPPGGCQDAGTPPSDASTD